MTAATPTMPHIRPPTLTVAPSQVLSENSGGLDATKIGSKRESVLNTLFRGSCDNN
jgi:hypothetical protein